MTTELAERELGTLAQKPAIDLINERQLKLLQARSAKGCSFEEVAQFLELCVAYGLDPYAGEAWCSKGRGRDGGEGKLLIMVGRDGLRKIALRNGLEFDGDVVREHDSFKVTRNAKRERVIEHEYEGGEEQRGPIVGAWAESYDQAGTQRGYFFAHLREYRPTNEKQLQYSPWGAQESVMILAAAERQALRQATPLGGLLVEGEDARINEPPIPTATVADLVAEWAPNAELAGAIMDVFGRAEEAGHAGLSDYATAELTLKGRDVEAVELWIAEAHAELTKFERAREEADGELVQEAEVVDEGKPEEAAPSPPDASTQPTADEPPDERVRRLNEESMELLNDADMAEERGDAGEADQLRERAKALRDVAEAISDTKQEAMEL